MGFCGGAGVHGLQSSHRSTDAASAQSGHIVCIAAGCERFAQELVVERCFRSQVTRFSGDFVQQ